MLVLRELLSGSLNTSEAARLLSLSERQVRRLKVAVSSNGPSALVHGNRGRRSPRRVSDDVRDRVVKLATTTYAGQNHQQMHRLLRERERLVMARSTLRRVLLAAGLGSPVQRRDRRLPAGMTPVAIDLARRRVDLLDLRGADFRESSFQRTAERWQRECPEAASPRLDLEEFVRQTRREPGRQPDGFVFSVARFGSTVLGGILSQPDQHLVIKESPAVNALIGGVINATDEERAEREDLLEYGLPFMFRPTRGTEERLLFTLTSWNARMGGLLLQLFPRTPAAFLFEPPLTTVASMLARQPAWRNWLERPRAFQTRYFPSLATVPPHLPLSGAAFYAHAWRSAVEAMLALPLRRLLVLDSDELMSHPESALARLRRHFDLESLPNGFPQMSSAGLGSAQPPPGPALDSDQAAEVHGIVGDLHRTLQARGEIPV